MAHILWHNKVCLVCWHTLLMYSETGGERNLWWRNRCRIIECLVSQLFRASNLHGARIRWCCTATLTAAWWTEDNIRHGCTVSIQLKSIIHWSTGCFSRAMWKQIIAISRIGIPCYIEHKIVWSASRVLKPQACGLKIRFLAPPHGTGSLQSGRYNLSHLGISLRCLLALVWFHISDFCLRCWY